jgi:hypothetical protein
MTIDGGDEILNSVLTNFAKWKQGPLSHLAFVSIGLDEVIVGLALFVFGRFDIHDQYVYVIF